MLGTPKPLLSDTLLRATPKQSTHRHQLSRSSRISLVVVPEQLAATQMLRSFEESLCVLAPMSCSLVTVNTTIIYKQGLCPPPTKPTTATTKSTDSQHQASYYRHTHQHQLATAPVINAAFTIGLLDTLVTSCCSL
jgi:hypothetical protein